MSLPYPDGSPQATVLAWIRRLNPAATHNPPTTPRRRRAITAYRTQQRRLPLRPGLYIDTRV